MYSILLLGATGYTGTLCAKFIAEHYPTNVHWCIGGRSEQKLRALARELRELYPDRVQPGIELVELTKESLESVVRKAEVVVNGVGPFHRFSTPIVEACSREGTHYLDFSTETLWIAELIEKYEDAASESGAVIIPGISPTAPADLLAWLITKATRERYSRGPGEIVSAGKLSIKAMTPGSLTTVLDSFTTWGASWYLSGNSGSWVLTSRKQPPRLVPKSPLLSRTLGYRLNPVLGPLTTSFTGPGNAAVVHRSAAQNPELYGEDFQYKEYLPATGIWNAIFIHCATKIFILLLWIPLVRGLVRKLMASTDGDLPDQEVLRRAERAEYRAVGGIGGLKGTEKGVIEASLLREGALYEFTALLTCVGARVLLERKSKESGEEPARKGGFFTPSFLGMEYVDGLRDAGVQIEMRSADGKAY
ncbi:hypothetical protein BO86DRAFT_435282 [Aspergillus japonicus CBS 114.51]|uniref:Saccharopine dehydrogenase NADP binding domain-containing protein n=1 Tax=Aspergillus japonicus CBS 114.51 TaxID=1448312 RepID=A0A8T8WWC5_ASPJA|nr:hypothetical protein BO86DRAFT_435282 [Aspergillus japonicus CBS 114.51]RAH79930.1 hypothetical protein BO86DRAFT_435282 [Aspergillus japonicus CBS 114.51]